jgi:carbon starvation protein
MNGSLLILISLIALALGYFVYGGWLSRLFQLDDRRPTPAHSRGDGVDYVPAPLPVLMGHHFASIAGAAPIVGPVLAASFGWLPVLVWILIGGIFMGAVHDFLSLVASLRHEGRSIGSLIEAYIGHSGRLLFLAFSWLTLLLVVAVFTMLVSGTFTAVPAAASSSLGFILLAVAFGFLLKSDKLGLLPLSLIGVTLLFLILLGGQHWPLDLAGLLPGGKDAAITFWRWIILGYIFIASITPVHLLLQPRDYLNSFLLYAMMAGGLAGIFVASPELRLPAFAGFSSPDLGFVFPILFVTVACGAISGFHSLVSSGTTARQLSRESHARPVTFGSMLIESLLAVVALVVVASSMNLGDLQGMSAGSAIARFSSGLAGLMSSFGLPEESGTVFTSLAVSAFALTSLDTATRIGRFVFEELAEALLPDQAWLRKRHVATLLTVGGGALLLFSNAGKAIWPLFGAANQLLATIALLTLAVWLSAMASSRRAWYVLLPMFFMFAVTTSALVLQLKTHVMAGHWALALIALLLLLLAIVLALQAWRVLRQGPRQVEFAPLDKTEEEIPDCPC